MRSATRRFCVGAFVVSLALACSSGGSGGAQGSGGSVTGSGGAFTGGATGTGGGVTTGGAPGAGGTIAGTGGAITARGGAAGGGPRGGASGSGAGGSAAGGSGGRGGASGMAGGGGSPVANGTLFVAPGGDDANPGTMAQPLKTVARARDRVRAMTAAMTGDITVVLRGGTYPQTATLAFTNADSGKNGFYVKYMAYTGEQPIITGGQPITARCA